MTRRKMVSLISSYPVLARAAVRIPGPGGESIGGGASPISLVAKTTGTAPSGAFGTSPNINSSGATLLIGMFVDGAGGSPILWQDSNSNTWHQLTTQVSSGGTATIYYSYDKSGSPLMVGAGHNVNFEGNFPFISFSAWSGLTATVNSFDQTSGDHQENVTSIQPSSSVTPTTINQLIVTVLGAGVNAGTFSVDSGFTIMDQSPIVGGTNYGGAFAYILETSIVAKQPLWTLLNSSATSIGTSIATFKP